MEVLEGETSMEVHMSGILSIRRDGRSGSIMRRVRRLTCLSQRVWKMTEKLYIMAWEMGCKGITVYRDGSKDKQVLRAVEHVSPGVGHERFGSILIFITGCGSIHVTCNELSGRLYEVYVLSEGGCPANNEVVREGDIKVFT